MNPVAAGPLQVADPLPASATATMAPDQHQQPPVAGSGTTENDPRTPENEVPVPLIAATATGLPVPGWLILTVAAILAASWYVAHCAWWPFAACRRCAGAGKHRSPSGKAWRTCRRCKGSGARLRTGRRVWNFVRSRREASR